MSSTAIVIPMLVESKRLHSGAGRASLAVLLVSGSRGRASARHDRRVVGGRRAGPRVATPHDARAGCAGADRAGCFRPPRVAAVLSLCRGNEEPRILHGGVPAGRARRRAGRRGEPFVDGARRLCRRAPAGGDRISPRDRSDDRTVPGPAARALLPFGWGHDQSGVHPRATRRSSLVSSRADGGEGSDAVRTRSRFSGPVPRRPPKRPSCSGPAASSASS